MVKTQPTETCTHCQKDYTKKCSLKKYCKVHKASCFTCKNCVSSHEAQYKVCSICSRSSTEQEMFYDSQCNKYYCVYQFLNYPIQNSRSFKFPCSHKIARKQFTQKMSNLCYSCGRKRPQQRLKQAQRLYKCHPCTVLSQEQSKQKTLKRRSQILLNLNSHLMVGQSKQKSQFIASQILKNKAQQECIVCLQDFDEQNHIPHMICMRQHMLCSRCLQIVSSCPLCKSKINKKQCLPFRQIIQRLKLQKIAAKTFQKKQKQLQPIKVESNSIIEIQDEIDESQQKVKKNQSSLIQNVQRRFAQKNRQRHFQQERQEAIIISQDYNQHKQKEQSGSFLSKIWNKFGFFK